MPIVNPISIPSKRLSETITASDSTFKVNNIKHWPKADGSADDLAAGDFGDRLYAVFKDSAQTRMELMEIDKSTIASDPITISKRGLQRDGNYLTEVADLKQTWVGKDTIIEFGSNPALLLENLTQQERLYVNQTHTFVAGEVLRNSGTDGEYAKAQADTLENAQVAGIVDEVIDGDNFILVSHGYVSNGVPSETANTAMYLSSTVAGAMTSIAPTSDIYVRIGVVLEDGVSMLFDPGMPVDTSSAIFGGGASVVTVEQVGHNLSLGDVIKSDGTDNSYEKAQADSRANAEVVGIVSEIVNADNFRYTAEGLVNYAPAYAAGTVVWLDPATAGALTDTEPTGIGQVSKPLGVVVANGSKMVFSNWRGFEIDSTDVGLGGNKVKVDTTQTTVANTVTETILFDTTLEGGWLSTGNAVKFEVLVSDLDHTSGTLDLDFYYGSSTVLTLQLAAPGNTFTGLKGILRGTLVADNLDNAQKISMQFIASDSGNSETGATVDIEKVMGTVSGTSAIDSTVDQTFKITAEWGTADAANSITTEYCVAEIVTDNLVAPITDADVSKLVGAGEAVTKTYINFHVPFDAYNKAQDLAVWTGPLNSRLTPTSPEYIVLEGNAPTNVDYFYIDTTVISATTTHLYPLPSSTTIDENGRAFDEQKITIMEFNLMYSGAGDGFYGIADAFATFSNVVWPTTGYVARSVIGFMPKTGTSTWYAKVSDGTATTEQAIDSVTLSANVMHAMRIEWDPVLGEARFYIDGRLEATVTTDLPTADSNPMGVYFGQIGAGGADALVTAPNFALEM